MHSESQKRIAIGAPPVTAWISGIGAYLVREPSTSTPAAAPTTGSTSTSAAAATPDPPIKQVCFVRRLQIGIKCKDMFGVTRYDGPDCPAITDDYNTHASVEHVEAIEHALHSGVPMMLTAPMAPVTTSPQARAQPVAHASPAMTLSPVKAPAHTNASTPAPRTFNPSPSPGYGMMNNAGPSRAAATPGPSQIVKYGPPLLDNEADGLPPMEVPEEVIKKNPTFKLGARTYTYLDGIVLGGRRHSVICVVMDERLAAQSVGGSGDVSLTLDVFDNSILDSSPKRMTLQFWRKLAVDLPQDVQAGDVIIADLLFAKKNTKSVMETYQLNSYKTCNEGPPRWAYFHFGPGGEPKVTTQKDFRPLSQEEHAYAKKLWNHSQGQSTGQLSSVRRLQTLGQVRDKVFFDTLVEIVHLPRDEDNIVYVTDYTKNPGFDSSDDRFLLDDPSSMTSSDDTGEGGHVMRLELFSTARVLRHDHNKCGMVGAFLNLKNVRPKLSMMSGVLVATLGNARIGDDDFVEDHLQLDFAEAQNSPALDKLKK